MVSDASACAPASAPTYFQWIDALRGAAALVIVVFHYHHFYLADNADRPSLRPSSTFPYAELLQPIFKHGAWAVELFWVISGFVFAHVYSSRAATLRQFVFARFARLYPLHFVTLLYVAALQSISVAMAGHWQIYGNNDLRHFLLQLSMSTNLINQSRGLSFNGPIWSVSMELGAYAMFFVTLTGIRRFPVLLPLVCCVAGFSLGVSGLDLPVIRLQIFTCAGYFFAGCTLYGLCNTLGWQVPHIMKLSLGSAVAAGLATAAELPETAIAVLASTTLVALLAALELRQPSTTWPLRMLGDISYSVYLIHVPLQISLLVIADVFWNGSRAFADSLWLLPTYVAASVLLAIAAHHWIEKPAGRWIRRKAMPAHS